MRTHRLLAAIGAVLLGSCGNDQTPALGPLASAGQGGSLTRSGGSPSMTGGIPNSTATAGNGGTLDPSSRGGGAPLGGTLGSGGAQPLGGVQAMTGGAPNTGGAQGSGGAQNTGGTQNLSGGTPNLTGGAPNTTGGAQNSTGGTQNSGGTQNPSGGARNTGSTQTLTGGVQSTGGAQTAAGGAQNADGTQTTPTLQSSAADPTHATSGPWHGYLWPAVDVGGVATISPTAAQGFTAGGPPYCVSGHVPATINSTAVAMVGMNTSQERTGGAVAAQWTPTGVGILVNVTNTGGSPLRLQIQTNETGAVATLWCAMITQFDQNVTVLWSDFNTKCWDNSGTTYDQSMAGIATVMVLVPGTAQTGGYDFNFCVNDMTPV